MKKLLLGLVGFVFGTYILICAYIYLNQESFIFIPQNLDKTTAFSFEFPFEEKWVQTDDTIKINAIHAYQKSSKGVIMFLHGNGGSLQYWGSIAPVFLEKGYDFFALDYRSYGKSHGYFNNEQVFLKDIGIVYDSLLKWYPEEKITIIGHSLGSAPASWLASNHQPHRLILLAPFFSIKDEMKDRFSFLPTFLLKYPFENNLHLSKTKCPVSILHGENDFVILPLKSKRLYETAYNKEQYILVQNCDHSQILFSKALVDIL